MYQKGFTLVELVVAIAIIGVLTVAVVLSLNPLNQLNKAYDVQRVQDLSSITTALDTYYNDNNCYPRTVPFGKQWGKDGSIYMQKVPNDPQYQTNGGYQYFTDTNSCPQWNVLFTKISNPTTTNICKLPTNCLPSNYSNNWACKVSGKINCSTLLADSLPTVVPTTTVQSPGTSGTTTSTTTLMPTPTLVAQINSSSIITPTPTPQPNIIQQTISNIVNTINPPTIEVCHATGAYAWQYVNAPANATVGGYDSNPYDIIPPFNYACNIFGTCNYPGKNWTTTTNDLWLENCKDLFNADSNGVFHGPDGTWCKNSNSVSDFMRQTSCTDETGTYYSACFGGTLGIPICQITQPNPLVSLHQFTAGCLHIGTVGACSNIAALFPGVSSTCSQGMCTGFPSSNLTPPNNITFYSYQGLWPIGGGTMWSPNGPYKATNPGIQEGYIKANTVLEIAPAADDPTHMIGVRMLTVSVNGEIICRRLPPQVAGCLWNVPLSIPSNTSNGNKIDIQITATSGEGATASQDFLYKLVQ